MVHEDYYKGPYILLIFRLSNTLYNFENAHQQNYKHFFKTPMNKCKRNYLTYPQSAPCPSSWGRGGGGGEVDGEWKGADVVMNCYLPDT